MVIIVNDAGRELALDDHTCIQILREAGRLDARALQRAEELTCDVAAATESAGDATSAESNADIH